jgi:hypothetical protein
VNQARLTVVELKTWYHRARTNEFVMIEIIIGIGEANAFEI